MDVKGLRNVPKVRHGDEVVPAETCTGGLLRK